MSHIIVKWSSEDKWDVYSVRCIKDEHIAAKLCSDPSFLDMLHGKGVRVEWEDGHDDVAFIIAVGTERSMEKQRNSIVEKYMQEGSVKSASRCCNHKKEVKRLRKKEVELQNELERVQSQLQEAKHCLDAARMAKEMRKLKKDLVSTDIKVPDSDAGKVKIGECVFLDGTVLKNIEVNNPDRATRFARDLMRAVFTTEELTGKSLTGGAPDR